ncbi:MFS transporter [Segetibacter sp. 3557_3]|uniref:MFS transporter n=1 Tax=Segetibacter sp. 3557_3 TaxID=2547429 RepID=UPI0010589127|nr:MFS transporter [Segetibacter sp. 3557_3]TDH28645.1 MFS transporter [Segetibacter sp. 3557_3]
MAITIVPGKRRWFIVAIIFVAIVFNYLDRQIVSILKPVLKGEFNLGDDGYAVIINLFTICYAVMYPVSGWLVDRFGAKRIMFFGIIGWSLACIGGGISRTVGQFGFFRAMLGLAEPTNFPAQLKVITIWFPGKLRATANSLCVAGSSIGAIIAPPLVAWLAIRYNWHTVFYVSGAIGLFIAISWWLIYRDPPKEIIAEAVGTAQIRDTRQFRWGQLWRTRTLWGILLIRFISDPVWYFCLFWLPGYLQEASGLTLAQVGMVGWIPFLVADLGSISTSAWSDRMVKNGMQPLAARKKMLTTIGFFAPLCALTPYLPNAVFTLAIFSIVAIAALSWLFTISVVIAEAFPVNNAASVLGIAGGFGAAGAVLFNYFIGQFIGTLGAEKIFIAMALLHPIAILILWIMVRKERPANATSDTITLTKTYAEQ